MNTLKNQLAARAELIETGYSNGEELYRFLFDDVEESYEDYRSDILGKRKLAMLQGRWMRSATAKKLSPKKIKAIREFNAYMSFDVDPLKSTFGVPDD